MAAARIPKSRAVTVRRAGPEDAPAIAAIHVTAWHETYTGLLPDTMISSPSCSEPDHSSTGLISAATGASGSTR